MATLLGTIIADFETQLATKIAVGGTSLTLLSATDDDGVALPAGRYFFTIDGDNSLKEHIAATLSGTSLTAIKTVSRQGAETSGVLRAHRIGAKIKITDFGHLDAMKDLLAGAVGFNASTPLKYDGATTPTLGQYNLPDWDYVKAYADGLAIAGAPDSSTSVKGIGRVSVAPASATIPIFVGDNDPRVPTQAENDAMAGTSGTPSSSNKYVTADDVSATPAASKIARYNASAKLDHTAMDGQNIVDRVAGEAIAAFSPVFVSSGNAFKRVIAEYRSNASSQIALTTASGTAKGQTFNSGNMTTITGVRIKLDHNVGTLQSGLTVTANIYATSGGTPTGSTLGSVTSSSILGWVSGQIRWIELTFATPITVSADTQYCLSIHGSSTNIRWYYDSTALYTGGQGITNGTTADAGKDYAFQILSGVASPTAGRLYKSSPFNPLVSNPADESGGIEGVTIEAAASAGDTVGFQSQGEITGLSLGTFSSTISEATDQTQTATGSSVSFDATKKYVRQTFTTGATVGNITALELYLSKTGTPGDVLTASIHEIGEDGLEMGESLGSVTFANADVTTGFVKKTFSSAITVKPLTKYIIFIYYGTYVATNYFTLAYTTTATDYPNGEMCNNNEQFELDQAIAFKTYYTASVNAYAGDSLFLTDACKIGYDGGYNRRRIGRIISASSAFIDLINREERLHRVQSFNLGQVGLSAKDVNFPISNQTKKVRIFTSENGFDELRDGQGNTGSKGGAQYVDILIPEQPANIAYANLGGATTYTDGGSYVYNGATKILNISYGNGANTPTGTRFIRLYEFK